MEQLIANCNDCKKVSIFEINEDQDPFYVNGKRLRECIKCGRYEEVKPEPELATRHSDNEVIDVTLTEDIAFEEGLRQGKLAQKKEEVHKISASLQSYIDGVALNILYRNYHKSTNGIWSRAEVEDVTDNGCGDDVYVVNVDFGCQYDTRNESYREQIYIYQKEGEWTMFLEFKLIDEEIV